LIVASAVILAYPGLGVLDGVGVAGLAEILVGGSVPAGAGVDIVTLFLTKLGLDKFIDIEGTQNCNIS